MKSSVILMVTGILGAIMENLEKKMMAEQEIWMSIEARQTPALLKSAGILRRVLEY